MDEADLKGVLGIIDSDDDTFTGQDPISTNIISTDAHDLECLLYRSPAFKSLINQFGEESKIKRIEEKEGVSIRQAVMNRALIFGRVKLALKGNGYERFTNEIRVAKYLDENDWNVQYDRIIEKLSEMSSENGRTWDSRIASVPDTDQWFIVCGHDISEVLRIGLRSVLGNTKVKKDYYEKTLRAIFTSNLTYIKETGLWKEIRKWETDNNPYRVFSI